MEFLKAIFEDKALTYAELETALKDSKDIKIANLASGGYVDKSKLDTKIKELSVANDTIEQLKGAVNKFDGVDIDGLNKQISELQTKYDKDLSETKLQSRLEVALATSKAKNIKAVKSLLDMNSIALKDDELNGFEEQITKLKETDSYLFEGEKDSSIIEVNSGNKHEQTNKPNYDNMTDEEYYKEKFKKE